MKALRQTRLERLRRITLQRKWAHGKWSRLGSRVYAAAAGLEALTFRDGALARKHKELIALGIAVITDCESCMQWHMEQAVQAGASQEEVVEAIEVAIEMGVVPATVHARFALEVLDGLFPERPSEPAGEFPAPGRRRGIRRSAQNARSAPPSEPAAAAFQITRSPAGRCRRAPSGRS